MGYTLEAAVLMLSPYLLAKLVGLLLEDNFDRATAYGYAAGLSLCTIAIGVLHHIAFFAGQRVAWLLRSAAIGLIYRKALRLSVQVRRAG